MGKREKIVRETKQKQGCYRWLYVQLFLLVSETWLQRWLRWGFIGVNISTSRRQTPFWEKCSYTFRPPTTLFWEWKKENWLNLREIYPKINSRKSRSVCIYTWRNRHAKFVENFFLDLHHKISYIKKTCFQQL